MEYGRGEAFWRELVLRGVESDELDYKSAMDWGEMSKAARAKIVRHVLAFANTFGGYLVIGVGEDASGKPVDYQGMTPRQLHSFDPSAVTSYINHLVDPPVNLEIVRPEVDGKNYVILVIKPFNVLPHVCASGVDGELQQGVFYIRTKGASSRPAVSALEMHGIILRALRCQRAQLGQMLRGILYEAKDFTGTGELADRMFFTEQEQYLRYFAPRWRRVEHAVRMDWFVRPVEYFATRCSFKRLRRGLQVSVSRFFREVEAARVYGISNALRTWYPEENLAAEIFQSGLFCRSCNLELDAEGRLNTAVLKEFLRDAAEFSGRLFSEIGMDGKMLNISWQFNPPPEMRLSWPGGNSPAWSGEAFLAESRIPAEEMKNSPEAASEKLFRIAGEAFLVPEQLVSAGQDQSR